MGLMRPPRYHNVDPHRRLRALLILRGETPDTLADRLGVPVAAILGLLTGAVRFCDACSVARVAAALDVPHSTIARGTPWPDVRSTWRVELDDALTRRSP